jgi:DNA-binding transcriptional regulator YdaS (Cro superfamily)
MKRKYVIEMTPPDFACLKAGSQAALARLLGISEPSIHFWRRSGRIPKRWVLPIEKAIGVPRYELRPDLYPR